MPKLLSPKELSDTAMPISPPHRFNMICESRAALDAIAMLTSTGLQRLRPKSEIDTSKSPIITLPGFAADDRYMKPLRKHLEHKGYQTHDWGLGTNLAGLNLKHKLEDISDNWDIVPKDDHSPDNYRGEGGVPYLCDIATTKIKQKAEELNSKVVLLGWSLGGYVAREVARDLPDHVAHIITLGTPIIGGPKYTAAARYFNKKGFDLDWIERESSKRENSPIQQAITAIYSKTDAIVNWRSTIDKVSPNIEHIQVNVAHLGMGFNQKIWRHIIQALEKNELN